MRTLVLGLGNPLLTDDAVGLCVARVVRERLAGRPDVEVDVDHHGGLRLMERMIGYDRAIIVDAMRSGRRPGTVLRVSVENAGTEHCSSAHDATLPAALEVGRRVGASLPDDDRIVLIGVEADDVETFGESCSPEVENAIPNAVEAVLSALAA